MGMTKNDLGVDCINRAELLKAMDTWDKFGYTTRYGLERLDKDDKGFAPYVHYDDMVKCVKGMPSVTPQEPFINKPCVSEKVCEHDKQMVLDKIRAEISTMGGDIETIADALAIIDKYKAESEEK